MKSFFEWRESLSEDDGGTDYFKSFVSWYNFHRGSWDEVQQVSARSPMLARFIDSARRAANEQGNCTHFSFDFNGNKFRGMAQVGNTIEKLVGRIVPGHSKQHPEQKPISAMPGMSKTTAGSNSPTVSMHAGKSPQDGSFINYLKHLDQRLKHVENRIGVQPRQYARTS